MTFSILFGILWVMPIDVESQRAALEALEMEKFHNGDPDPEWPIDPEKMMIDAYYEKREADEKLKTSYRPKDYSLQFPKRDSIPNMPS